MTADDIRRIYSCITIRRAQILAGLADLRTEPTIADELCVSLNTVRSHVRDLKELIGVHSVRDLARWWREHHEDWEGFQTLEARGLWRGTSHLRTDAE